MPVWKGDRGTVKVVGSYAELKELSGVELDDYHRPWVDDIEFDLVDGKPVNASELNMYGSGQNAVREELPISKRACVDAVIVNEKGEYLLLDELNRGVHLVGGGVDPEDTDSRAAILREI